LTKTGTHNWKVFTQHTATQPPSKSSNILTHDGVRLMSMPRKIYAWHTRKSGMAKYT
jgi:hypothetical protein